MTLDLMAANYQGACIVEAGSGVRRVFTNDGCVVLDHATGVGLVEQGSAHGRAWWHEPQPYYRPDALAVESDGPATITIWERVTEDDRPGWIWRRGTVQFGGPADFNVDGAVDVFDFLAFQTAFAEMDMAADFDADGELTFWDFLAFFDTFGED